MMHPATTLNLQHLLTSHFTSFRLIDLMRNYLLAEMIDLSPCACAQSLGLRNIVQESRWEWRLTTDALHPHGLLTIDFNMQQPTTFRWGNLLERKS